jgi:hypothetical protein
VKLQPDMKVRLSILPILVVLMLSFSAASSSKVSQPSATESSICVLEPQECSKCEGKCKSWIDKCKDGGQYACYKAAACLCKCNLDAGGCGSSKEALQECYEKNEKLAKDLGPQELQRKR